MSSKQREHITYVNSILILKSNLPAEIRCPICLDIIQNAHVVQECFHRFCGDCIRRCHGIKNECPACLKRIPTHRSLKADQSFDDLISALFRRSTSDDTDAIDVSACRERHNNRSAALINLQQNKKRSHVGAMVEDVRDNSSTDKTTTTLSKELYVSISINVVSDEAVSYRTC